MPGSKVIIHKGKGEKHEYCVTHLCSHCATQHLCSVENGHTPEDCKLPPHFTCPDCEARIFRGSFTFGQRFDDCHEDCEFDEKFKYYKHVRKCEHNYDAIIEKAMKEAENGQ